VSGLPGTARSSEHLCHHPPGKTIVPLAPAANLADRAGHDDCRSTGEPRVNDRRVLSAMIFVNRNGWRWREAPKGYGTAKTLYNGWKRWSGRGIFAWIMDGLASEAAIPKTVMIDSTYLKAHRTATSLRSKRGPDDQKVPSDRPGQGRHEHKTACRS
jgi:transposase